MRIRRNWIKLNSANNDLLNDTKTKLLFGPAVSTVAKPSSDVHILAYLYTEIKSWNYCKNYGEVTSSLQSIFLTLTNTNYSGCNSVKLNIFIVNTLINNNVFNQQWLVAIVKSELNNFKDYKIPNKYYYQLQLQDYDRMSCQNNDFWLQILSWFIIL